MVIVRKTCHDSSLFSHFSSLITYLSSLISYLFSLISFLSSVLFCSYIWLESPCFSRHMPILHCKPVNDETDKCCSSLLISCNSFASFPYRLLLLTVSPLPEICQGPFSSLQMAVWLERGLLPDTLKVRKAGDKRFRVLSQIKDCGFRGLSVSNNGTRGGVMQ